MISSIIGDRLNIKYLLLENDLKKDEEFDIMFRLTHNPKSLPPQYFYDELGSKLFEKICELPEYYPTRTEAGILKKYGTNIAQLTKACELIELGSGSSTKTRILLDAYQDLGYPLRYLPIDVSASMLSHSAKNLLLDYPTLEIEALVSTYEIALENFKNLESNWPERMIVFLGSTLGNFTQTECDRFLEEIQQALKPGDYFLLGIDLEKPKEILNGAYNDSQGITAKFNLNILSHLNWRFGANFDLDFFEHWAFYNERESQIEMYLKCKQTHQVYLEKLNLKVNFTEGETIHTEISRKFNLEKMQQYLTNFNLKNIKSFTDLDKYFGLILSQKQ